MKDGVLLANAGHFDVEVDKDDLKSLASEIFQRKNNITGYKMEDGRILNLLGDGRLVNLAAGNGHPTEIMDLSFAIQALCLEYLAKHGKQLMPDVYDVPKSIDEAVARVKLDSMGLKTDTLTTEQKDYITGF